jgi:hypothetical protein
VAGATGGTANPVDGLRVTVAGGEDVAATGIKGSPPDDGLHDAPPGAAERPVEEVDLLGGVGEPEVPAPPRRYGLRSKPASRTSSRPFWMDAPENSETTVAGEMGK